MNEFKEVATGAYLANSVERGERCERTRFEC